MKFLESILQLLESNKKLPYYQAERRIDIFINFFIEDIIQQHTSFTDAIYLAAEFPLKKSPSSDHAAHIDYLMYSELKNTILLVELKTDDVSYSPDQIKFYLKNKNFKIWYDEFETIKMKGFAPKKENLRRTIIDTLKGEMETYNVHIIVLKPTLKDKDCYNLESNTDSLSFVALNDLDIKTKYQEEWDTFRRIVLCNFHDKPKIETLLQ